MSNATIYHNPTYGTSRNTLAMIRNAAWSPTSSNTCPARHRRHFFSRAGRRCHAEVPPPRVDKLYSRSIQPREQRRRGISRMCYRYDLHQNANHPIYHQLILKMPKATTGLDDDLFALVGQAGSSNCFECGTGARRLGRRSRGWQAFAFGRADEVILEGIRIAGDFEGRSIKMRHMNGHISPETYIRSIRRQLVQSAQHDICRGPLRFKEGHIYCHFAVPAEPADGEAPGKTVDLTPYGHNPTLSEWLASAGHVQMRTKMHVTHYLRVSGPDVRT